MERIEVGLSHKITHRLEKRPDGASMDDPPTEVITWSQWYEADGSEVSDPERIRELEESVNGEAVQGGPEGPMEGLDGETPVGQSD
jgi:hypothetical protein